MELEKTQDKVRNDNKIIRNYARNYLDEIACYITILFVYVIIYYSNSNILYHEYIKKLFFVPSVIYGVQSYIFLSPKFTFLIGMRATVCYGIASSLYLIANPKTGMNDLENLNLFKSGILTYFVNPVLFNKVSFLVHHIYLNAREISKDLKNISYTSTKFIIKKLLLWLEMSLGAISFEGKNIIDCSMAKIIRCIFGLLFITLVYKVFHSYIGIDLK